MRLAAVDIGLLAALHGVEYAGEPFVFIESPDGTRQPFLLESRGFIAKNHTLLLAEWSLNSQPSHNPVMDAREPGMRQKKSRTPCGGRPGPLSEVGRLIRSDDPPPCGCDHPTTSFLVF